MAAANSPPKGSKPDKLMRDALMLALNREAQNAQGQPTKKLHLIADAIVDKAVTGDVPAAIFVRDSVDGKPAQIIEGNPDAPLFSVDGLRDLLGAKLDRIAAAEQPADPSRIIN